MRYAIITDGVVTNVAKADVAIAPNWVQSETAQIGWLYDGETFTEPPPAPVIPPESVGNDQARIALILTQAKDSQYPHLLAEAEAIFDALAEPQRSIAKARMEYSGNWRRASEWIAFAKQALGLSESELDDLFLLAAEQE